MSGGLRRSPGFTLVELLITVVLVGLLAALFIPAMGTHLTRSGDPVGLSVDEAQVASDQEAVVQEYVRFLNNDSNPSGVLAHMAGAYAGNASVTTSYIDFDAAGNETACGSPPDCAGLKVTVRREGHAYTMLLTNDRNSTSYAPVNY